GQTGGGTSNKAVFARYPEDDVTVAVLLNTERTGATVVATDIEEAVERRVFDLAETPQAARVEGLERYAGRYRDGGRLVRVGVKSGTLELLAGRGPKGDSALVAQGGDVFMDADKPAVGLRFQLSGGNAQGD